MFHTVSIIAFAAVLAAIALHFLVAKPKFDKLFGPDRPAKILDPLRLAIMPFVLLFVEQENNLLGALRKLVFIVAVICAAILTVTGFVPPLVMGKAISGWWLVIHATCAPVFAACIAILAVMWAGNCTFDKNYLPWLNKLITRTPQSTEEPEKYEFCKKISFWIVIFLALPVILSAVLSMFPIFGTHGQENLLTLHRYSTLILVLTSIIYLYLMTLSQMNRCASK